MAVAEPALELDLGASVPIGSTGNRLSSNPGWVTAIPIANDDIDPIVSASFADALRFR